MMSGTGVSATPNVKCDLYTFSSGPYSSQISVTGGPYIIVYGFVQSIYAGDTYQFDFPNILIGSNINVQGNIRFSIL
jgi:hypothetical protein